MWAVAATFVLAPRVQDTSDAELIRVARAAVVAAVTGKRYDPPGRSPARPVFVTIEVGGAVVGCRGRLDVVELTLERAIASATRSAATTDPRRPPASMRDLDHFLVTVTIVRETRPLDSITNLSPEDGLVLRSGGAIGVVLPWEGRDPKIRLDWAIRKAGIAPSAPYTLERLIARRFRG